MEKLEKLERLKNNLIGISFLATPLVLIFGFASHPNLASLEVMTSGEAYAAEFRKNNLLLIAHVGVMFCALLFMGVMIGFNKLLAEKSPWLGFVVLMMGCFGSFMLGVDKGAFALVPSAFDTLSDAEFEQLMPGFDAMINYEGLMWLAQFYFFIPLAMLLAAVGLYKTGVVPKWQAIVLGVGSALFFNPDIDVISLVGSIIILFALLPMGASFLKKTVHI